MQLRPKTEFKGGCYEDMPKTSGGTVRVGAAASKTQPPPAGEARSTRDQVTASMREMTQNRPGLIAKLDHPFQSKHQHDRCTGTKAGVVWSCAEEGTAAALGHSSASEYGLSCKPHELGETKG